MNGNITRKNITDYRVYYSDTDCGGVVYYANYLKYFEIGRTELFRDAGIELEKYHNQNIIFIVVKVEIEYKMSAKYNDLLKIHSSISDFSKKTFTVYNETYNENNQLLVKGFTKCACISSDTKKIISLPEQIIVFLNN